MTIDELGDGEIDQLDAGKIRDFLDSHTVGVLGLPTDGAPGLRPMSYWFDGEDRLYLLFVEGEASRKRELTVRADAARFLVYAAETPFIWRSVLLTGTLTEVPEERWDEVEEALEGAWRPDVFRQAMASTGVGIYEFLIEEESGIASRGVPPGFEADEADRTE